MQLNYILGGHMVYVMDKHVPGDAPDVPHILTSVVQEHLVYSCTTIILSTYYIIIVQLQQAVYKTDR